MARPLRIEYPGAFYHVTSRGNERKDVFKSQRDREKFIEYLASATERFTSNIKNITESRFPLQKNRPGITNNIIHIIFQESSVCNQGFCCPALLPVVYESFVVNDGLWRRLHLCPSHSSFLFYVDNQDVTLSASVHLCWHVSCGVDTMQNMGNFMISVKPELLSKGGYHEIREQGPGRRNASPGEGYDQRGRR